MSKVFNTILIILIGLGVMGIVLGITISLYRNDQLARMQVMAEPHPETDNLTNLLLNGNLHTVFLGAGTFLTLIAVGLFLISVRKKTG